VRFTQDELARFWSNPCSSGGAGLVRHSFVLSLREAYPNHDWLEWRFPIVSPDFWNNRDNQLRFVEWAGRKLGYKTLDHWYAVSREKLVNLGGAWACEATSTIFLV
jgi:hypothetical protein